MRSSLRPLHLLLLAESLVEDGVDARLNKGRRDGVAVSPAFAVVRDESAVVLDVGPELTDRLLEFSRFGIRVLGVPVVMGRKLWF